MSGGRWLFDGFSLVVPAGWSEVLEDATYSDPDQPLSTAFAASGGVGRLYLSAAELTQHAEQLEHVAERMVLDWGRRRGLPAPLSFASELDGERARATAVFRVATEFVQIWALTDGCALVEASYAGPWEHRDRDREGREAMVRSLQLPRLVL
jgi:hypothetical protein